MKNVLSLVSLLILILFSCQKEESRIRTTSPEICDFGQLNTKYLLSREEFESAKGGGGPRRIFDKDKDGVADNSDNCPNTANTDQKDSDKDGIGDVCDSTPFGDPATTEGVLLLDFDGYYLNSTMWNGGQPKECLPSGLYPEQIQIILDNVKADYAKYKILVTTDENTFLAASKLKRMRVVITTSSEIYPNVAGIAYVGSMFWGDDTPCFVFSNLTYYDNKRVRAAVSHEAGHTVGLYHQANWDANCNLISSYKSCNFTTNTGPIMGNSASCTPLWWVGPTPSGCNSIQDDNAILTSKLGLK